MLTTPGGISVRSAITLPMCVADHGVSGAGFSTIVQPDASAGPIFAMFRYTGTFHGVIAPTTPTGSRRRMRPFARPKNGMSFIRRS